jgi:hypothetical protein
LAWACLALGRPEVWKNVRTKSLHTAAGENRARFAR